MAEQDGEAPLARLRTAADDGSDGDADDGAKEDTGDAADPTAETAFVLSSPRLLDSVEEQRKRNLIRARLFGESPELMRIGRFVPVRRLGAGGMGVVYVAYDEQLDRKVAVKLLRSENEKSRSRLLREAQALARLAHPNIVNIYEVGVAEGRVFIAMELVPGKTLREWLGEAPRTVTEVLAAFEQAGRGLIAVHQQGLIHRDFKPDNVLIGDDGRVRIVDFGLARWVAPEGPDGEDARDSQPLDVSNPVSLQEPGPTRGPAGTPFYMAPEQHLGATVDARSDQYSFCVALFEGLYGEGPFAGKTVGELAANKAAGRIRSIEDRKGVPEWLLELVLRGLRPDPDERWPSMAALLAELTRDRRKWRRRAISLGVLGLLVLLSIGLDRWAVSSQRGACSGARVRIDEVWGPAQHAAVRQSLLAGGASYAEQTFARVKTRLDQYVGAWAAMHTEACLAHARGEQSAELLDLRMACLDRRRDVLRATVQVLAEGAPAAQAVEVAGGVMPIEACADAILLRSEVKPPADAAGAREVARLRERIGRAEAEERAGRYERGLAEASQIVAAAKASGYAPVLAEALFVRASLESRIARYQDAVGTLEAAYVQALANRQDELAGEVANLLLYVLGYRQGKFDAVRPWEHGAEALVLRLPQARQLAVDFYGNRGLIRVQQGQLEPASADTKKALSLAEQVFGSHHLKFARVLNNAGQIEMMRRDHAATLRYQQQALAIREENLGPEHPVVASSLNNVGSTLKSLGRFDEALVTLQRALLIHERAVGVDHPDSASILRNTAEVLIRLGRYDEAQQALARAQKGLTATQPGIRLRRAGLLATLSTLRERQGRGEESAACLQEVVDVYTELLPADHIELGAALAGLGEALLRLDRGREAEPLCRRALSIAEAKLGSGHTLLAGPLLCLAQLALARSDTPGALAQLERAATILSTEPPSLDGALLHSLLARVLAERGAPADAARVVALAGRALKDYEAAGPAYQKDAGVIRAFLAARDQRKSPR